jgi:hypothetical protein
MRNTLGAILATAMLATTTAGCGGNRISTSAPPDAAFAAASGDANFAFNYDGAIPDLPQRNTVQQPPRITTDANRPMQVQTPNCPMNPQGAACSLDGGGTTCRVQIRNNVFDTCFCMQGTYRCPGLPMPRPDAGAVDARSDVTPARPDAMPDATRG